MKNTRLSHTVKKEIIVDNIKLDHIIEQQDIGINFEENCTKEHKVKITAEQKLKELENLDNLLVYTLNTSKDKILPSLSSPG